MAEKDVQSEKQDELILGKFKSPEEAKAHLDKLEKERLDALEKLEQERRLNNLLATEERPTPSPKEPPQNLNLGSYVGEEGEQAIKSVLDNYRSVVLKEAGEMVRREVSTAQARQRATQRFYSKFADLSDYEDVVDAQADRVAAELGPRLKGLTEEQYFAEVAKRTREYVSSIANRASKTTLHLESGEVRQPKQEPKQSREEESSESQRTADYFREEAKLHNQRRINPIT